MPRTCWKATAETAADRFDSSYRVCTDTGCWVWVGPKFKSGYGRFAAKSCSPRVRAHRYSYERFVGPIPDGILVCHTCDNRPCVNPRHLFLGTIADNNSDASEKGRPIGRYPSKTRSNEEVREMRRLFRDGTEVKELAEKYELSQSACRNIVTGRTRRRA